MRASRIENLQVWDALTSFVAELATVDARQADIGEEQNDFRMLVQPGVVSWNDADDNNAFHSKLMEAVGQLTGGIAHDFNNLLTAIQGSIELVFRGPNDLDPETKRLLTSAMRAAERGGALTHQLLAFSRQQTLAPQDIDINRRVAGMAEMLRRTLGESRQTYFRGRALTGLAVQILAQAIGKDAAKSLNTLST